MRFWIALATLVLIALGFTLVIAGVNLDSQEVGSVSIAIGVFVMLSLSITAERQV